MQARQEDRASIKSQWLSPAHRPNTAITRKGTRVPSVSVARQGHGNKVRGASPVGRTDEKERWGIGGDVELLWDENRREFERRLQGLRHRVTKPPSPSVETDINSALGFDVDPIMGYAAAPQALSPLSSSGSSTDAGPPSSEFDIARTELTGEGERVAHGSDLEAQVPLTAPSEDASLAGPNSVHAALQDQDRREERRRAPGVVHFQDEIRPRTALPASSGAPPSAPRRSDSELSCHELPACIQSRRLVVCCSTKYIQDMS